MPHIQSLIVPCWLSLPTDRQSARPQAALVQARVCLPNDVFIQMLCLACLNPPLTGLSVCATSNNLILTLTHA